MADTQARVLTAAARTIDLTERKDVAALRTTRQWQTRAWGYFDLLGIIKYAARYHGKAMSRAREFVGVRPSPDSDLVPVEDAALWTGQNGEPPPIPADLAAAAAAELARIRDERGGVASLRAAFGMNLFVAGECFLLGEPPTDPVYDRDNPSVVKVPARPERWSIRSVDEMGADDKNQATVRDTPDGEPRVLGAGSVLVRMWEEHPRWKGEADSSVNGVADDCETLVLAKRSERQGIRRSLNAGLLLVAQEFSFGPANATKAGTPGTEGDGDPLTEALMEIVTATVDDESNAATVAPSILRAPGDKLKNGVIHADIGHGIDEKVVAAGERAFKGIADGVDLPREVLTGTADLNHWSAWAVKEDAYKGHFEPALLVFAEALAAGVIRPALNGPDYSFDPEQVARIEVGIDPSAILARPSADASANDGYDRGLLSGEAWRRYKGYDEGDAPDDEERERILAARRPAEGDGVPGQETPPEVPEASVRPVLVAATDGPAADLSRLAARLTLRERALRDRLHAAADAALRQALVVAGKRAKSRVASGGSSRSATARAVADVPLDNVCATLGPAIIAAGGMTDEELLREAFEEFGEQFASWTASAQAAALDDVAGAVELPDVVRERVGERQASGLDSAWVWLRAALLARAASALYDPHPNAPGLGEDDPDMTVPVGVIRAALRRAGGAGQGTSGGVDELGFPLVAGEALALGATLGPALLEPLSEATGIEVEGYTWTYGVSRRPFEPHAELDGVRLAAPDDDRLRNDGSFPPGSHFAPGDHVGCGCDLTPTFIQRERPAYPFNVDGSPLDDEAMAASA